MELCEKKYCTGCKACSQICGKNAISFVKDNEGFEYPIINTEICIKCQRCVNTCPVINRNRNNSMKPQTILTYAKDINLVKRSSSGGIFGIISNYILTNGGWVYGAYMEPTTFKVYHIGISDLNDLYKLQGSKYIQSDINNIYKQVKGKLDENCLVLFSGTPCQVAGLYSYLNKNYENLYTIDVVCHGVPSYDFFVKYLKKISIPYSNISYIDFKNMKIWNYDTILYLKNKEKKILIGSDDFYMRSFLSGEIFRESCYRCPFTGFPRVADLTLGDFWGVNKFKHKLKTNRSGNSVVLINNQHGHILFNNIADKCFYEDVDLDSAIKYNHNIYESCLRPNSRDTIYSDMDKYTLKDLCEKYDHKFTFRNYLGCIKRRILNYLTE